MMKTNNLYSIIVEGDINVVDAIFKKNAVKYREDDFYPGKGYVFVVSEERIGGSRLVKELRSCDEIFSVDFSYIVDIESV